MRRERHDKYESSDLGLGMFIKNFPHVFPRQRIEYAKEGGDIFVGGTLAETSTETRNTVKKIEGNPFLKNNVKSEPQDTPEKPRRFYYEGNSPKVAKRVADLLN